MHTIYGTRATKILFIINVIMDYCYFMYCIYNTHVCNDDSKRLPLPKKKKVQIGIL